MKKQSLTKNKYYKLAYNNPKQYSFNSIVESVENTLDESLLKILVMQLTALNHAKRDHLNGSYKFI